LLSSFIRVVLVSSKTAIATRKLIPALLFALFALFTQTPLLLFLL
jgi:hypothetical protein